MGRGGERGRQRKHSHARDGFVLLNGMGMERQGLGAQLEPMPYDLLGMDRRMPTVSKDTALIGREMKRSKYIHRNSPLPATIETLAVEKGISNVEEDVRMLNILSIEMRLSDISKDIEALSNEIYASRSAEATASVGVALEEEIYEEEEPSVEEGQNHERHNESEKIEPLKPTIKPIKEPDDAPNSKPRPSIFVHGEWRSILPRSTPLWKGVEIDPRIHIMGMGHVGQYIAHSLASVSHPWPITLLMHRPLEMQQWHDEGAAIRLVKNGTIDVKTGFHIESSAPFHRQNRAQRFVGFGENLEHTAEPPKGPIHSLIVTTPSEKTLSALGAIKHRILPTTTICLIQDGLGIIEQVNTHIFPNPKERPTYILGNINNRFSPTGLKFTLRETRSGSITCSQIPPNFLNSQTRTQTTYWTPLTRHLMMSLAETPSFRTITFRPRTYYKTHLEHLVVACAIGPISAMLDCTNDQLLHNRAASEIWKSLLEEYRKIILAMPELAGRPGLEHDFSVRRMNSMIVSCLQKSGKNQDAMLIKVRAGKKTNIDFFNGYLAMRARELGIPCPINDTLYRLIKGKQAARSKELNGYIPFRN